jgi:nucleoside-diphosphate-sugar epimerase
MSLTCAVTGANGYVGGVIAAFLGRHGCNVVELGRKPSAVAADDGYRQFGLGDPVDAQTLSGIDALVHCAYDFKPIDPAGIARSNVEGTLALFRAARAAGVKQIIFISSMSAFEGCKSLYGQAKLSVEKKRDELGLVIVRPGLVYGSGARGMVGSLAKLASIPLVTPLVGLGNMILYLAHEEDLGGLISKLLDPLLPPPALPIIAANDSPRTLRQIISILGASQNKGNKLFLPVPSTAVWAMLKTAEAMGLRPRLRSDSLVSLMNQDPHPDFAGLRRLGAPFREFETSALAPGGDEAKPR